MVNFSFASFTNTTNITRREGDREVPSLAGSIIIIIINTTSFPCTVILNVLVIKAVKTTPRLRTNSNILLACLAVTDALTGLLCQPLFILWRIFLVFGLSNSETAKISFISSLLVTLVSSYLHLMLVTFERLSYQINNALLKHYDWEEHEDSCVSSLDHCVHLWDFKRNEKGVSSTLFDRPSHHFMYSLSYFR